MSDEGRVTLSALKHHARTDSDGSEKAVLSLHDRVLSRIAAPPIAWLALKLGISADMLTALSILMGLAAALCLGIGSAACNIAAAVLLQISYLIDCADGDVARATGKAGINGYLRDTMRHYLAGPALFCGWTLNVYQRHSEIFVVIAGLLATFMATRIVGDLEDRVTLDGLIKRLKQYSASATNASPAAESRANRFMFVRGLFLRDLAIMNWLTLGVVMDLLYFAPRQTQWLALDYIFFVLAAAQVLMKTFGLLLLWRRGVSGRIEAIVSEIEAKRQQQK